MPYGIELKSLRDAEIFRAGLRAGCMRAQNAILEERRKQLGIAIVPKTDPVIRYCVAIVDRISRIWSESPAQVLERYKHERKEDVKHR